MKFDDILRLIGEFGPYQKRVYFYICISAVSVGIFMVESVTLLGTPEHRCKIPGLDNDTYAVQSESHLSLINATIPPYDGDEHTYNQCHLYSGINVTNEGDRDHINGTKIECSEWVYDTATFQNTFTKQVQSCHPASDDAKQQKEIYQYICTVCLYTFMVIIILAGASTKLRLSVRAVKHAVNVMNTFGLRNQAGIGEFGEKHMNLVCRNRLRVSFAQTMFFFGVLLGLVFGQLSDAIGRKKTLCINTLIIFISSVSLSFASHYYVLVALLFLVGSSCLGTYMTGYIIGMEFVGPSKRVWAAFVINYFETSGALFLILMCFLIRDWKYVQLSISLPCVIYLLYWWLIPESPRWLLSRGRQNEALKILQAAASRNRARLSQETLAQTLSAADVETGNKNYGFWNLFSTKTLAFRTIIIYFNWIVVAMSFYGVILNVGNLGGNFYVNFTLMVIVDYPTRIVCIALADRIGRKKLYIGFMVIGGLACIATIFPLLYADGKAKQIIIVTLSIIGKIGVTGGFDVLYILSAEVFPTVVRNIGMGTSSAFARVGSMISPYVAQSAYLIEGTVGQAIPLMFFGAAAFIAGLLSLTLPETLNRKMPDTIEDTDATKNKGGAEMLVLSRERSVFTELESNNQDNTDSY